MNGDFVGRGGTGIATSGQNLGTVALPWGTVRANSVVVGGQAIDPSLAGVPQNVVISGAKRSTSNQPFYLVPNGAALTAVVDGTPTSLVYDVNGTEVTVSIDITISGLTAAPAANNTCLVNDADAADQFDTHLWGEYGHRKTITVDAMGSEITALIGKFAAFQLAGTTTEYFVAFVQSSTELRHAQRGFFLDSSGVPVKRCAFSDNDTITLLKLGAVFIENNGTSTDVSYNNPHWGFESPTGPTTGDYWYDTGNMTWKRYDGAVWQIINRTHIGWVCNTTSACVGARSVDFYSKSDAKNDLEIDLQSTEIARVSNVNGCVSVKGETIYFGQTRPLWNITTDLVAAADAYNASEQSSTMYYLYLKDTGDAVMSDYEPYWRPDLGGWYHPHNPWRNVGLAFNDSTGDLVQVGSRDVGAGATMDLLAANNAASNNVNNRLRFPLTLRANGAAAVFLDDGSQGSRFVVYDPGVYNISCAFSPDAASTQFSWQRNTPNNTAGSAVYGQDTNLVNGFSGASEVGTIASSPYLYIGDTIAVQADAAGASAGNENKAHVFITKRGK